MPDEFPTSDVRLLGTDASSRRRQALSELLKAAFLESCGESPKPIRLFADLERRALPLYSGDLFGADFGKVVPALLQTHGSYVVVSQEDFPSPDETWDESGFEPESVDTIEAFEARRERAGVLLSTVAEVLCESNLVSSLKADLGRPPEDLIALVVVHVLPLIDENRLSDLPLRLDRIEGPPERRPAGELVPGPQPEPWTARLPGWWPGESEKAFRIQARRAFESALQAYVRLRAARRTQDRDGGGARSTRSVKSRTKGVNFSYFALYQMAGMSPSKIARYQTQRHPRHIADLQDSVKKAYHKVARLTGIRLRSARNTGRIEERDPQTPKV